MNRTFDVVAYLQYFLTLGQPLMVKHTIFEVIGPINKTFCETYSLEYRKDTLFVVKRAFKNELLTTFLVRDGLYRNPSVCVCIYLCICVFSVSRIVNETST